MCLHRVPGAKKMKAVTSLRAAKAPSSLSLGPAHTGLAMGVLAPGTRPEENESGDKSPHSKGAVHTGLTTFRHAGRRIAAPACLQVFFRAISPACRTASRKVEIP